MLGKYQHFQSIQSWSVVAAAGRGKVTDINIRLTPAACTLSHPTLYARNRVPSLMEEKHLTRHGRQEDGAVNFLVPSLYLFFVISSAKKKKTLLKYQRQLPQLRDGMIESLQHSQE